MAKIMGKKPSKDMYFDAIKFAIAKSFFERIEAPVIGNGNLTSGLVKAGIGFVVPMIYDHEITRVIGGAHIIDSAEDLINTAWQWFNGANGGSTDIWS